MDINTWWSFIKSAVIQIGDNSLEVQGGHKEAKYWIDGEAEGHEVETETKFLGPYEVNFARINDHQTRIHVDLGNGDAIR